VVLFVSMLGAAGKANDAAGGQDENQARVSYSGFHGSLRVDWLRLAVERASTAGVNSIFVCHENISGR
jgi:hypothetical protein